MNSTKCVYLCTNVGSKSLKVITQRNTRVKLHIPKSYSQGVFVFPTSVLTQMPLMKRSQATHAGNQQFTSTWSSEEDDLEEGAAPLPPSDRDGLFSTGPTVIYAAGQSLWMKLLLSLMLLLLLLEDMEDGVTTREALRSELQLQRQCVRSQTMNHAVQRQCTSHTKWTTEMYFLQDGDVRSFFFKSIYSFLGQSEDLLRLKHLTRKLRITWRSQQHSIKGFSSGYFCKLK